MGHLSNINANLPNNNNPIRKIQKTSKEYKRIGLMRFILTQNNNFMVQGQMSGSTPMVNGTAIGVGGPRAPGDMNNNGLSGPALGPVKPPPMSMQAPTS